LALAQRLVAAVLPLNSLNLHQALAIAKYTVRRNHIAYQSHRKKRLREMKSMENILA
jgi:hypothetical protein